MGLCAKWTREQSFSKTADLSGGWTCLGFMVMINDGNSNHIIVYIVIRGRWSALPACKVQIGHCTVRGLNADRSWAYFGFIVSRVSQ